MKVCLTHWSALECWRHFRVLCALSDIKISATDACREVSKLPSVSFSSNECKELCREYLLSYPVQVLTKREAERRSTPFVRSQMCNVALNGKIYEVEEGLMLVSPELCFLQLSKSLDFIDLVMLGYELLSIYVINPATGKIVESPMLVTMESLGRACEKYAGTFNKKTVERALRFMREKSASPRETGLAMKLLLPISVGGFGIKGGAMNEEVTLSERSQSITGTKTCKADLLFEAYKIDVEYDSNEYHTPEQWVNDNKRRLALRREGYTVISVSNDQFKSTHGMISLAQDLANYMGMRLRLRNKSFEEDLAQLNARFNNSDAMVRRA